MVGHRYYRLLQDLLVLGLLLTSLRVLAEPLHPQPLLSRAAVDSVRALLQQSKHDTGRVNLLIILGRTYADRSLEIHSEKGFNRWKTAERYSSEALTLSKALRYTKGQIQSMYILSGISFQDSHVEKTISLFKEALRLSQRIGNKSLEAEGWYYFGDIYDESPEGLSKKIKVYEQSRKLYRQSKNKEKEAYMLKCIADVHMQQGQYAQAYTELQEVLALYRSVGYRKLHYTYDLLTAVNRQMGNYKEAVRYGLACLENARANHDTMNLGLFYMRLGVNYEELNQLEEGHNFYVKALINYKKHGGTLAKIFSVVHRISANLINQGRANEALTFYQKILREYTPTNQESPSFAITGLAECYLALKQYSRAEKYYQQILRIEKINPERDVYLKKNTYQRLGNIYLMVNQYDKAHRYLDTALYLNHQGGMLKEVMNIHLLLFKTDSAQGHYKKAIHHYQRYKSLNDSIFNETQSRQIANLQIQYKIKEKEQNIRDLIKARLLQDEQIKREELIRNGIIATTVLLFLLLALIYNRYRLKQRSNRLLEAKQQEINQQNEQLQQVLREKNSLLAEKENLLTHKDNILQEKDGLLQEKQWLLREVHHRVKNNLQVVVSLLSSQAAYLLDEKALLAIQESQNRIHAISLIHQKLYLSENIALVEMNAYIHEVADYLLDSFQMGDRVQLQITVDPIELDGAIAVPMGLIINEAVTNSLKYAFPGGRNGQISISLQAVDGQTCLLTIADDGIGLDQAVDLTRSRSLGMVLMKGLTKQLEGTLTIDSTDGLTISVLFNKSSRKVSLEESVR